MICVVIMSIKFSSRHVMVRYFISLNRGVVLFFIKFLNNKKFITKLHNWPTPLVVPVCISRMILPGRHLLAFAKMVLLKLLAFVL